MLEDTNLVLIKCIHCMYVQVHCFFVEAFAVNRGKYLICKDFLERNLTVEFMQFSISDSMKILVLNAFIKQT